MLRVVGRRVACSARTGVAQASNVTASAQRWASSNSAAAVPRSGLGLAAGAGFAAAWMAWPKVYADEEEQEAFVGVPEEANDVSVEQEDKAAVANDASGEDEPQGADEAVVEMSSEVGAEASSEVEAEAVDPELKKKKRRIEEFIEMEKYFEHRFKEEMKAMQQEYEAGIMGLKAAMERQLEEEQRRLEAAFEQRVAQVQEYERSQAQEETERQMQAFAHARQRQFHEEVNAFRERANEEMYKALEGYEADQRRRAVVLADLNAKVRELQARLASTTKKEELISRTHRICAAVFTVLDSLEKSRPFSGELTRLRKLSEGDEKLEAALEKVSLKAAQQGVSTPADLLQQFLDIKNTVRTQALVPADGGMGWQMAAGLLNLVTRPVKGNVTGSDPDAILARAEYALQRGDVQKSIDELSAFTGLAGHALQPWLEAAESRVEVERALRIVREHVAATVGSQ